MGLILDSSVLIAGERRRESVRDILKRVTDSVTESEAALSAITVAELTHGVYRARTDAHRQRREAFVEQLLHAFVVYPITLEIAQLAGRIEGQQAAQGINIAFPDLLIGATALHLGYAVATLNVKHFQLIPGLAVVQI